MWKKVHGNVTELLLEDLGFESMIVKNKDIDNINISANILYYLEAPVEEGKVMGYLDVLVGDENVATLEIYNKTEVKRKGITDYLKEFCTY